MKDKKNLCNVCKTRPATSGGRCQICNSDIKKVKENERKGNKVKW